MSMVFAGWASTTLIIPPIADKIDRRNISVVFQIITIIMLIISALAHDVRVLMALMFLAGASKPGCGPVAFVFACEFLTQNQKLIFSTQTFFNDGMIMVIITLFYWFIGNQYLYLHVWGPIFATISLIGIWLYMPESPLW